MAVRNSKKHNLSARSSTATTLISVAAGLDLVRHPGNARQIQVLHDGSGSQLLAPELARCAQALVLPSKPVAFGTLGKLFGDICDTLQSYFELTAGRRDLLALIVIASWFPEYLPLAPIVVICGSAVDAQPLLRVLRCLCRHGLLVTDLIAADLTSKVMQLMPTLIITHQRFSERLGHLLVASSMPGCTVLVHGEPRTVFCTKIIFEGDNELPRALARSALRVTLDPATRPPRLNDTALKTIGEKFQNRLLGYRLALRERIASSDFDVPAFASEMRIVARALGACVLENRNLQARVIELLSARDNENRNSRGSDIYCVVIEAVLFHVREGNKDRVFVAEIAKTVNDLLRCRHEPIKLRARFVGQRLTDLGFDRMKRRSGAGISIPCNRETAAFVEELARKYQVLSAVVDDARSGHEALPANTTQ